MNEELQKSSLGRRFGAFLIDHLLFTIPCMAVFFLSDIQKEPEKLFFLVPSFMLIFPIYMTIPFFERHKTVMKPGCAFLFLLKCYLRKQVHYKVRGGECVQQYYG